jgi:hypothetical protein
MGIIVDEERVELLTTIIHTLTTCGGTKLTTILTSYTNREVDYFFDVWEYCLPSKHTTI